MQLEGDLLPSGVHSPPEITDVRLDRDVIGIVAVGREWTGKSAAAAVNGERRHQRENERNRA